ncbi:hypothetical protein HYV56_00475 [Candidatus Peregrinibacteria bacterium]|nr:hypothetical protein [Candidatus Peregrinibacteria bacterium]
MRSSPSHNNALCFGSFKQLQSLLKRLNQHPKWSYSLIKQKNGLYLIEEDLGDEYLNYALIEVKNDQVYAFSPDVMRVLEEFGMKAKNI